VHPILAACCIRRPHRQPERRGPRRRQPPNVDRALCRSQVQQGSNQRKHWRGLATRFAKAAGHCQATLDPVETLYRPAAVDDERAAAVAMADSVRAGPGATCDALVRQLLPERAEQLGIAAGVGGTPSADLAVLQLLVNDLGTWLADEYAAVHGKKAARP
jgi:hypothetical protein